MAIPFGKYALQRKLAEGGMAELYLARQGGLEGFEKLVVIKRILPALSQETQFVQMFLNEARVAARLNHPNVVQIWDLGQTEGLYFIAMEFVHGEDLTQLVHKAGALRRRPSAGVVCRIMADTLAGLHYAHTRTGSDGKPLGLVHRDVSPQNVLVTYAGSVKLVDFGIAKATRATSEQTRAGLFKGKFAYMSPEQSGGQNLDARSDVFAVGVLLWELLTWRRLFKRPTDMATLVAVAEDPISTPRSIEPRIPVELDRIVMKALARPLAERYQSAHEMRADLEALIRTERWAADTLAIESYMRDVFADKLQAQSEEIRASGLASLEDFLLHTEAENASSWVSTGGSRTPSIGLPANADPFDAPHLSVGSGPKALGAMVLRPLTEIESGETLLRDVVVPSDFDAPSTLESRPSEPPAPVAPPAIAAPAPPPPTKGAIWGSPAFSNESVTNKRRAYDPRPQAPRPRGRRLLVIGATAIGAAGLFLAILSWPRASSSHIPTFTPSVSPMGAGVPVETTHATLVITLSEPALIRVDGVAQPFGREAIVHVKPGIEHVVNVERPGKPSRTLNVPALANGERLPIKLQ